MGMVWTKTAALLVHATRECEGGSSVISGDRVLNLPIHKVRALPQMRVCCGSATPGESALASEECEC